MRRGAWSTRLGFYLAAIGSAFGLGSLWRFPYIVAENGGGAFVILYFFLVLIIGVPMLVGELFIGRITKRSVLSASRQLVAQSQSGRDEKRSRILIRIMPIAGWAALICCGFILGYYSVISGWVLYHFLQFLLIPFQEAGTDKLLHGMDVLRQSGGLQLTLALAHLLFVAIVVGKGVEEGIERAVGVIIPVFVGILLVLIYRSISLEGSGEALRFFLYPDFSKLSYNSLAFAIGHVCFTLSIGFGTMVTFGSYFRDEVIVPQTGLRVATLDSLTTLIAGLLIFPLVFSTTGFSHGPELLFQTVPAFLLEQEGGLIFGLFFFLCLYLAAIGASISLFESIVANLAEKRQFTRARSSLIAYSGAAIATVLPAFSSTTLKDWSFHGRGFLESADIVLINWVVPLLALIFVLFVVYEISSKLKRDEFLGVEGIPGQLLYAHWSILMKWIVPPVILLGFILQLVGLFK